MRPDFRKVYAIRSDTGEVSKEAIRLLQLEKYINRRIAAYFPVQINEQGTILYISPTTDNLERLDKLAREAYNAVYYTDESPPKFVYALTIAIYDKYVKDRERRLIQARQTIRKQEKLEGYKPIRRVKKNPRKKQKDKAKSRRRKNPFRDKEEIPLSEKEIIALFQHLKKAILFGRLEDLSYALILSKIGFKCDTCEEDYMRCACEGSRFTPGMPCEDCGLRFCMCGYNLSFKTPRNKIRQYAWTFAKTILNRKEQKTLKEIIFQWFNEAKNPTKFNFKTQKYIYSSEYDRLKNEYSISEGYIKGLLAT